MAKLDSALHSSVSGIPFAGRTLRRTTMIQPASGPATLAQTQAMNQDYQQVMQPPVSNLMGSAFVTLQHDPKRAKATELVTVSNDAGSKNGIIWFYPDSASGSGWAHESSAIYTAPQQYGEPMVPSMLLPFYQGDTLVVFAEYDTPGSGTAALLGMQRTPQNGWEQVIVPTPLSETMQNMAQSALFYGQDGQGYLYGVDWSDPKVPEFVIIGLVNGSLANLYSFPAVAGASYTLLPGPQAGDFVALQLQGSVATFQAGTIQDGSVTPVGSSANQDLGVGDLAADTVVPILGGVSGQPAFLLLAQNQQLYLVTGNGLNDGPAAKAVQITGATGSTSQPGPLLTVTGGSQPDGSGFTAFALDVASNRLWMLAPPTPGADYAWTPMGNTGIAIATPALMAGGPELFLCDPATVVSHITQRAETGSWFTMPIATPSPSTKPITETSSFTQQFTLTSAAGVPMAGELLKISASPAQVLVVNNIAYNASPNQPATVRTNGAGSVVIASAATGLASPVLTVTGAALASGTPPQYRGDTQLHQRIAAQGGFSYSGQDLVTGGVLPANTSSSDADQLATNLQQVSGVAVNIANGGATDAARRPTAFTMKIEGKRLHSRVLTATEFDAIAGSSAADSVFGDAWGDFAHFCKQAWDDIKSITVQIAETTAKIAVELAQGVENFVLTTIDDIRDALEVMLQFCVKLWDAVVNVIEKFIEFIKLLFDWDNIINTKTVLRYMIEQLLQDMQDGTSGAQQWIGGQIKTLSNNINTAFEHLESVFEPGMTFASAGQNPTSTAMQQQSQANAVQNNYVMSKSLVPMPQLNPPVTSAGYDPETAWQTGVLQAFQSAFDGSEAAVETAWEQISGFMDEVDSVASFLDFVIASFLSVCQATVDIVLQLINAAIDSMLDLMAGAAACLTAYLERQIDIPVISALYKLIFKDTLTMLDLICLILAVPTTIMYEVLHDSAPFTSQQVTTILGTPIPWPWSGDFQAETAGPFAVLALAPTAYQGLLEVLATVTGAAYTACDVICDLANIKGQESDGDTHDLVTGASALGIGFNLVAAIAGAPWYAPPPSQSPAAGYEQGTFAAGMLPIIADTIFFTYRKKLSRMQFQGGPWISMALGAVQTGMGIATAVEMAKNNGGYDYSLADELAGVLSGLSNLGKPFVFLGDLGGVGVVALDVVGDIGTIITDVAAGTK